MNITKTLKNATVTLILYGIGDSTNDISFTRRSTNINYTVFIENDRNGNEHKRNKFESYDMESSFASELSLYFKQVVVDNILGCIKKEIARNIYKSIHDCDVMIVDVKAIKAKMGEQ